MAGVATLIGVASKFLATLPIWNTSKHMPLEAFATVFHQFPAPFDAHTTLVRVYSFFKVLGQDCMLYLGCIKSNIRLQVASMCWAENHTFS